MKNISLVIMLLALLSPDCIAQVCSTPAPGITSPVNYCKNAAAVPLTATGSNLKWGSANGSVGGNVILTSTTYVDAPNANNNKKLKFSTLVAGINILSVDYYIPPYQTVSGIKLAIFDNNGNVVAISSTTTSMSSQATANTIRNNFNYTLSAAGDYSIGVYAGFGNIGSDNPSFPITESSNSVKLTGTSVSGIRCYNNMQFASAGSTVAPTPSTSTPGVYYFAVNQTVNGCTSSNALITVNVTAPPAASISYSNASYCKSVTATQNVIFSGTTGGTYSSASGLSINSATGAIRPSESDNGNYTVSYTMAGSGGCATQIATTTVSIAATPSVSITTTPTCVEGSTGVISASVTEGVAPFQYNLNSGTNQSSATFSSLAAGNYTLNVISANGCSKSSSVTIIPFTTATDDQNTSAVNSWIGHVYDGISFNRYIGKITETESFNDSYGGSNVCMTVYANGVPRTILTETFSVRFRMNSTRKGLYTIELGADDGNRLTVDGSMIFNNWNYQSFVLKPSVLMNLNGNSNLLYEYFESNGNNQTAFQNFTLLLANNLSANTSQSICLGNSGSAISGDVFNTLPNGITTAGTGYQWYYSTSTNGTRIIIPGATSATYTPVAGSAPFNAAGTYYIFRSASLTSTNNISPNPYTATNESNAAIITISPAGQWTGAISTDWNTTGNWCSGSVPDSLTNVVLSNDAARMPSINNAAICKSLLIQPGATLTITSEGFLKLFGNLTNDGTCNNTGTISFDGINGQQTFTNITSFYNLKVNNIAGLSLSNDLTILNNTTITKGLINTNNYNVVLKGDFTNNASTDGLIAGTSTFTLNGISTQNIGGTYSTNFHNIIISNTEAVELSANIIVYGDLTVNNGTFDLQSFSANRNVTGGEIKVDNNAILKIGSNGTFPLNFSSKNLIINSTVHYYGTNQNIANVEYGNLVLSSSAGSVVKTFPNTPLLINGNFSCSTTGDALTFSAAANININGNVSIGQSCVFNSGNYIIAINGNWTNNGTFNGNTGTLKFTGTGTNIGGSGNQNYNNLLIAGSFIAFSNSDFVLTGNMEATPAGSFVLPQGSTLTMTGNNKTIMGTGMSFNNLTITGNITTAESFIVSGNLLISGSLTASNGTISMTGNSNSLAGDGNKSFYSLSVNGDITTAISFSIASSLSVTGNLTATSGTATFTGTSSLSGIAYLFNVQVNGTALQLSTNATMGIANALTITSGTLNTTSTSPNTVNFYGNNDQAINGINYYNLIMSGGNTKTASGNITTAHHLIIENGTTFEAGSYTHSIFGNWINNGTFIAGTSTVEFRGTATSFIIGATTFYNLNSNTTYTSTELKLSNDITAAIVNMTKGTIVTGTNTITITNTRTGAGYIYGNIKRNHSFITGITYAFEGPDNTILFSSVSGVNSITVSVIKGSILNFPYGNSIRREYDIDIPNGTYTATLRLHYEDDELNGNDEADMGLWNYDVTQWIPVGKTSNSTTLNYVEHTALENIQHRWTCSINPNVVLWNGSEDSDWDNPDNWTVYVGTGTTPPSAADVVVLGGIPFTHQPIISTDVQIKNLVFSAAQTVDLSLATGGSLTSGDVMGYWENDNTHSIHINDQSIYINGDLTLSDGINGHAINMDIASGTLNVNGSLIQRGNASVQFSNNGSIYIKKNFEYQNGPFAAGIGNVVYNGDQNQKIADINYYNLTIDKSQGLTSIDSLVNVNGNLLITSGELVNNAILNNAGDITITAEGKLRNYALINIGGNWNNAATDIACGEQIIFNGSGTQTISTSIFNNLTINKPVGSIAELSGDLTITGNLAVISGTLDIKTFECSRNSDGGMLVFADSSTFIIGGNNAPLHFTSGSVATASTVIVNGTGTQYVYGIDFGNIIMRNSGEKILVTPITIKGNFIIENGSNFNAGDNVITLEGNWINNGNFNASNSEILFTGINKTVKGTSTFNKATISGSYINETDNTYNNLLHITSTGSISSGTGINTTLNGDLINQGVLNTLGTTTFTGTRLQTLSLINAVNTFALIVNFNGDVSPVLNSTSAPVFGYLNINNTAGVNPSVGWNIALGLTVGSGASFNGGNSAHVVSGTLNNNGTITSSGKFTFNPPTDVTLNMGAGFQSTGTVVFGGSGKILLTGSNSEFANVEINNTNILGVNASSTWQVNKNLQIFNGSLLHTTNSTISLSGHLMNFGKLKSENGELIFNGESDQKIFGTDTLSKITIQKNAGNAVLQNNVAVNGDVQFIKGNIQTNTFSLSIHDEGNVTGAAQNTGWINGTVKKHIASSSNMATFEIGDDISYTPVSLSFNGTKSSGYIQASTLANDFAYMSGSGINADKSVNRTWQLENFSVDGTATYHATFNYVPEDMDADTDTALFIINRFNNNAWLQPDQGLITATTLTAMNMSLSEFGEFQIGESLEKPEINGIVTNIHCKGNDNGSITLEVNSNEPVTYSWTGPNSFTAVSRDLELLIPGTYTVKVTSQNGTIAIDSFLITEPASALSVSISNIQNILCRNAENGFVDIQATGGTSPYTFSLNGNAVVTENTFNNLLPGDYTINVYDSLLCNTQIAFEITEPSSNVNADIASVTDLSCNGNNSGSFSVNASGGTGALLYSLNGSQWQDSATFTNMQAGNFTVYIKDQNECSVEIPVSLSEPLPIQAMVQDQMVCAGLNATIEVVAEGGTEPFEFSLNGLPYQPVATFEIEPGIHIITINDANNCFFQTNIFSVIVIDSLAPPAMISGVENVCPYTGRDTTLTYTIESVPGATSYTWYVPEMAELVSGQGSTSVTIKFLSGFMPANLVVRSVGQCGESKDSAVLFLFLGRPYNSKHLFGPIDVCNYINTGNTATYYIAPLMYADSYHWEVPNGATIVSGQGDTLIQVLYSNAFTTGQVSVYAINNCFISSTRKTLLITRQVPSTPPLITGPASVCAFVGTDTLVTYSVNQNPRANGCFWSISGSGAIIVSGQGTNSIQVQFQIGYTSAILSVVNTSPCGNSLPRNLQFIGKKPNAPAAISGPADACTLMASSTNPSGIQATYTIKPIVDATSYQWTFPAGVSSVIHPESGLNDTIILIRFSNDFVSGNISVSARNNCGTSVARSLSITRKMPAVPSIITGPTDVCPLIGNTATYSIRKSLNASSYTWIVPVGVEIESHPGGSGVNDTSITVRFTNAFVNSSIKVKSNSNCGSSAERILALIKRLPLVPGVISGAAQICADGLTVRTYSIAAMPLYATAVRWTVSDGMELLSSPDNLSVQVRFNAPFASGNISVYSMNNCAVSAVRVSKVTNTAPAIPGGITVLQTRACPLRQYTYSLAAMPANATSILWSVPAGATIDSISANKLKVYVSYGNMPISDTVRASSVNNCGTSVQRKLKISLAACSPSTLFSRNEMESPSPNNILAETKTEMNIFPNPSNNQFTLAIQSAAEENITVRITDVFGKTIKQFTGTSLQKITFGTNFPKGMYFVEVIRKNERVIKQVLKL